MSHSIVSVLTVLSLVGEFISAQYTAVPRWGQATALLEDVLFIHGGMTDEFNSYYYTSAPVNNDLLSLSLASPFNISAPPWQYIAGCSNCSSSHGPAVAWHTLSAFTTSEMLLFGGDAGPNGPIADPEEADSAALLDVSNRTDPAWTLESQSWAGEPLRRIYHSASSTGGKIWLRTLVRPAASANGPPDLYGHASAVLPNGTLIVFGGYSPSQSALLPLSTIWSLDTTQSTLTWATLNTLPGPTATRTNQPSGTGGSQSGSGQDPTGSNGASSPSSSGQGHGNGGSSGSGGNDGSGNGGGDGGSDPAGDSSRHHATAIALGTVFGLLGLVAGASVVWYLNKRRRDSRESFHLLDTSSDDGSPHVTRVIPVAGVREKALPAAVQNIREKLGGFVPGGGAGHQARRDMLADEDTREFGSTSWYHVRRDGSIGQSSWSSGRSRAARPTLGDVMQDSLASLKNVGGAVLAYASGARSLKSREASTGSRSTGWWEKEAAYEPYSDSAALMPDAAVSRTASRPRGGRQASYVTMASSNYADPFADYEVEELGFSGEDYDADADAVEVGYLSLNDPPPRPHLYTQAAVDLTRLSPLSEKPSITTMSDPTPTSSDASHISPLNAIASSTENSRSSHEQPRSPPFRPSSIIDANLPPSKSMRRSDSWWSRFTKTPLLDRRSSDSARMQRPLDFRDPNPPPRLLAIDETAHPNSPHSPPAQSKRTSTHTQMYSSSQHGRSASSLQTSKTANSAMIEDMGRTMDIVQQGTMSSRASDASTDSAYAYARGSIALERPPAVIASSIAGDLPRVHDLVLSPVQMGAADSDGPSLAPSPRRPSAPRRAATGGTVAARVLAFEQLQDEPARPAPSKTKQAGGSVYGLAPKPSLFVANPDHRSSSSGT
ncbi:hypothetical protein A0H81_07623 [Grifola frondosa]|uniref:Galactose oxidase n=1 Tax=Grifola frondosa TaxID=5627 RepID=A0A1C7M6B9_GRIFR|nr:hypothetical protein A0H81_07623 [Grifola frondosa]